MAERGTDGRQVQPRHDRGNQPRCAIAVDETQREQRIGDAQGTFEGRLLQPFVIAIEIGGGKHTRILFASHSPQLVQRLMYDRDAAVVWMSEGAKVPVDDAQRPAIPILMTLGALSAGADAFDPARPVILMTEDKLPQPATVLAKANGAPENLAALSYNGCGNLPAARLLANMITDMRPDARIILHRDRDFRTDPEVQFELSTAAAERQPNGVTRVTEVFTPLNDVEYSFAQAAHLKEVFNDLAPELVDAAIADVAA